MNFYWVDREILMKIRALFPGIRTTWVGCRRTITPQRAWHFYQINLKKVKQNGKIELSKCQGVGASQLIDIQI